MRRIVLAACAAVAACTLVGILLGAYLHEIGIKTVHQRDAFPRPSTTVSTTVSTVTVQVTPQQAAQHEQGAAVPHGVVGDNVAPRHDAQPTGDPGPTKTTVDPPTTRDRPTATTTTRVTLPTASTPCRVGHRRLPPVCLPQGHRGPRQ